MNNLVNNNNIVELINDILNRFSHENRGRKRAVIFWYDENKDFEKFIDEETTSIDSIKYVKARETDLFNKTCIVLYAENAFAIRYYIEKIEQDKNIIIYFPYKKLNGLDNLLLDLESEYKDCIFIPNATSVRLKDLELGEELRDKVVEYDKFFKNKKRVEDFRKYKNSSHLEITNENFDKVITCILLDIKDYTEEGIIKEIFNVYFDNKDEYDNLFKWGSEKYLAKLISDYFSTKLDYYTDLTMLIQKIIMTTFATTVKNIDLMKPYAQYILNNGVGNVALFVDSIRRDKKRDYIFEKMSTLTKGNLKLDEFIKELDIDEIIKSDIFEDIDEKIINNVLDCIIDSDIDFEKYKSILYDRKFSYYYGKYKEQYEILIYSIKFLQLSKKILSDANTYDASDYVKYYVNTLHSIDKYYRKIIYAYDIISLKTEFKILIERIENIYVNEIMTKISSDFEHSFVNLKKYYIDSVSQQQRFYYEKIEKYENKKERAIVIISDAMRYEVASELYEYLHQTSAKVKLEPMLGVVPSYTKLGMASLLPHKTISMSYNDNREPDIYIDGINQSGIENRRKILENKNKDNACFSYDELIGMGKADWKKCFSGKKIIYIYHDKIDKTGEHDPNNIFRACEECIRELQDFVKQLDTTFSGVQIYITSDHGFFYKKGSIETHEKTNKVSDAIINKTRYSYKQKESSDTYYIDNSDEELVKINMGYILDNDNYVAIIPKGINTFIRQGSGFNYVHGGILPQEIIVPLIDYKSNRNKDSIDEVGISLASISNKITSNVTYIDFVQNQNVDDKHRPCRYTIHFEDGNGKQISTECEVIAEYKNTDVNKRKFKEKFTFKDIKFDKSIPYYLVVYNDKNIEVLREKFYIDIIIPNYFD